MLQPGRLKPFCEFAKDRDELVLEAHLDADELYILLRREGEPGAVRVYLGDVRYPIDGLGSVAVEMARVVVGDLDDEME